MCWRKVAVICKSNYKPKPKVLKTSFEYKANTLMSGQEAVSVIVQYTDHPRQTRINL